MFNRTLHPCHRFDCLYCYRAYGRTYDCRHPTGDLTTLKVSLPTNSEYYGTSCRHYNKNCGRYDFCRNSCRWIFRNKSSAEGCFYLLCAYRCYRACSQVLSDQLSWLPYSTRFSYSRNIYWYSGNNNRSSSEMPAGNLLFPISPPDDSRYIRISHGASSDIRPDNFRWTWIPTLVLSLRKQRNDHILCRNGNGHRADAPHPPLPENLLHLHKVTPHSWATSLIDIIIQNKRNWLSRRITTQPIFVSALRLQP